MKSTFHACALALAASCAASEQTFILENNSDSTAVLIRTLAEYAPEAVPHFPDGAEPFLAKGEVVKTDHSFCFRVVGDRFAELRQILERLYGQAKKERIEPGAGPKVARFEWNAVMFLPGRNETVVVGTRKSPTETYLPRNSPPKATFQLPPKYPLIGHRKIEGWAQVSFKVDCRGSVIDCVVDDTSRPEFGDAAVEALRRWHFRPAIKDGNPVVFAMQQRFTFKLSETMGSAEPRPYRMRWRH